MGEMAVNWRVPSARPAIDEGDVEAVVEVLRSGVLAAGPQVAALEAEFAGRCQVSDVVGVSSGTAALVLAGQALGLGRGDTVLVAGFTFAASANAFLSLGCDVVPVDVDGSTMNINAAALADVVDGHPDARAVVVVDLFGSTAGTQDAIDVARSLDLVVVEDAAQAHGATAGASGPVGSRADATTFSLYATKNVTAGEGGLVATPRPDLAEAVRRLRNHGALDEYRHDVVGLNHRLSEMAAALARRQLERLDRATAGRQSRARELAAWCLEAWGSDVTVPPEARAGGTDHVFHQFTVRFRSQDVRDAVADQLRAAGVDARHFYPYVVADLPGVGAGETPVAERLRDTVLSLPVHPCLEDEEWAYLRRAIRATRVQAAS